METVRISVIIPVYNMAGSLETCVHSLLSQRYDDMEIILVDDGSSDDSWQMCGRLAREDARVRCFHEENAGSGPARNLGIQKSSGEYLLFIDADDTVPAGALEAYADIVRKDHSSMIVGGYQLRDGKDRIVSVRTYERLTLTGDQVRMDHFRYYDRDRGDRYLQGAPWNKLFRKEEIVKHNIEYPALRREQDSVFISRYVNYAEKISFTDRTVYIHYVNDLRKVWDKFPENYIDIAMYARKDLEKNVLTWNKNDIKLREAVMDKYICDVTRALELTYADRLHLDRAARRKRQSDIIKKSRLAKSGEVPGLGRYHRMVLRRAKEGREVDTLVGFKVFLTKHGVINAVRRILN